MLTDETLATLDLSRETLVEKKAIEAGNIFNLGTRFSEALGLSYMNEAGESKPVVMGSYGIGPTRVMGIIAEVLSDEKGLVWPEEVAPFRYHLVALGNDPEITATTDALYAALQKKGDIVLYDDRDARAGEKFADSDLIGIPTRIVVGKEALASGKLEVVDRRTGEVSMRTKEEILA